MCDHERKLLTMSALRDVPRLLFLAIGIGVASSLLLFGLNYMSLGRGGEGRIDEAFGNRVLIGNYLAGDTDIGAHQFNDCLILGMATDQRKPVDKLTVSPTIPFLPGFDVCDALQKKEAEGGRFYHNYLHGQTTIARYLLPVMSVASIRMTYRAVITSLLLFGIGISTVGIASAKRTRDYSIFLIIMVCFARFFGLEMFGQSLGHGPSDAVLIGYILVLAMTVGRLSARSAAVVAALFGSATMIFELLTGGLPLGLAAVAGLSWFALNPAERSFPAVAHGVMSYLAAVVAVAATKLIAVAVVFGPSALPAIGRSVQQRVNGDLEAAYGERNLLGSVLLNMDALAAGLGLLSAGVLLIALASGSWSIWRHRHRSDVLLLGLSNIVVLAWPLVFQQHMMIHAWFMDRIFVWPIASGFALFALSIFYDHEDKPRIDNAAISNEAVAS